MALKLIASYSKRLGLPAYSSHQFSVSIETKLTGTDDIAGESARLYATLQQSVDDQIQHTGFVPTDGYGLGAPARSMSGANGNAVTNGTSNGNGSAHWNCSEKQRDLILKLIEEHDLDKSQVETLATDRFNGKGVRQLNKLEASGLIDEARHQQLTLTSRTVLRDRCLLVERLDSATTITGGRKFDVGELLASEIFTSVNRFGSA